MVEVITTKEIFDCNNHAIIILNMDYPRLPKHLWSEKTMPERSIRAMTNPWPQTGLGPVLFDTDLQRM